MDVEQNFLKSGVVSIDIFALSTAAPKESASAAPHPELQTTCAVGEEAEDAGHRRGHRIPAAPVTAPLDGARSRQFRRGSPMSASMSWCAPCEVGHFFPGSTVDALDS